MSRIDNAFNLDTPKETEKSEFELGIVIFTREAVVSKYEARIGIRGRIMVY